MLSQTVLARVTGTVSEPTWQGWSRPMSSWSLLAVQVTVLGSAIGPSTSGRTSQPSGRVPGSQVMVETPSTGMVMWKSPGSMAPSPPGMVISASVEKLQLRGPPL
jgi:hypothetical protein